VSSALRPYFPPRGPRPASASAAPARRSLGVVLALSLALAALPSGVAHAQSATDSATAESLFNEALTLLDRKKPAEACPKLEASQRLDPGVGTLLYLADCYQQMGRSASAWATFREAAYMAKDRKDDREPMAIENARSLEPKLSYLTVEVTPPTGVVLEIKRDGKPMADALWNTAIPVDPGSHTVEVSAPGKKPWSTTLKIAEGPRQESVVVPALEDAPAPLVSAPASTPPPVELDRSAGMSTQKTLGWVLLGVGSAGLITSGVLALLARGDNNDASAECRPDRVRLCNPEGVELGESAQSKATWAGVSAGIGLAALGAGVTVLIMAPSTGETAGSLALAARLEADGGQISLSQSW
jgi:tetratricopeptide (TPR) repeat protein